MPAVMTNGQQAWSDHEMSLGPQISWGQMGEATEALRLPTVLSLGLLFCFEGLRAYCQGSPKTR